MVHPWLYMFSVANYSVCFCTVTCGVSNNVQIVGTLARGNSLEVRPVLCLLKWLLLWGLQPPGSKTPMGDSSRDLWARVCSKAPRHSGRAVLKSLFSSLLLFLPVGPMTLTKPTCCCWGVRRISITHVFSLFALLHPSKAYLHSTNVTRICHGWCKNQAHVAFP